MIKIKAISWIHSKITTVYTDYLFDYIPILQPDYFMITIVYFNRSQHDYTI